MFNDFFSAMETIEADADRRTQELFGDSDGESMTDEEIHIIFSDMPHKTKLAKLAVLRAGNVVKPKTFARRITKAGRVHAAALGIRLD
jgi:hypothetical protein